MRFLVGFVVVFSAVGVLSAVAGADVTGFTVTLTPRRAEPGATVAIASSCTFTAGDEFSKVEVTLGSTTVTLTPSGPPVADGDGFRQDLTGSLTAPTEPGIYLVTELCLTTGGEATGNQSLTVLVPATTVPETTLPSTTLPSTTLPSPTPPTITVSVPLKAGGVGSGVTTAPQELAATGRYSARLALLGSALLLLGIAFSLFSRRADAS